MKHDLRPIGVFDSGFGGISVQKALCALLQNEQFVYYGDNANAPYGTKTEKEVLTLCKEAVKELLRYNVKAIVIACNTATAVAVKTLRDNYPDLPIIGVEPALRPAVLAGDHPRVLIMATPMTLHLGKFKALEEELSDKADLVTLPCPGLVEYIERGDPCSKETERFLKTLLKEHLENPPQAVVLGCTHYPFVLPLLKRLFPRETTFFDGAEGTARQLKRRLEERSLTAPAEQKGGVLFLSSQKNEEVTRKMAEFLSICPSVKEAGDQKL
ncbi:MAG: glutamate racemase [Clostridia bacterium]|nr:glutamate racemase [Clostridia bacterium]